tara:strand:- start:97 stop:504 length:408 start_codon:yes stop_codon:yes gene_type:complete
LSGYSLITEQLVKILRSNFQSIPVYISNQEVKNKNISIRVFPISQDLISTSSNSRLYEYNFEIVLYFMAVNAKDSVYKNYLEYSDRLESIIFEVRNYKKFWFDGNISNISIDSEDIDNDNILTTTISFNCKYSIV